MELTAYQKNTCTKVTSNFSPKDMKCYKNDNFERGKGESQGQFWWSSLCQAEDASTPSPTPLSAAESWVPSGCQSWSGWRCGRRIHEASITVLHV